MKSLQHSQTHATSTRHQCSKSSPIPASAQARKVLVPCKALGRREILAGTVALLPFLGQPAMAKAPLVVDVDKADMSAERDVFTLSTGVRYSDISAGTGNIAQTGDLVLIDVVGKLEDGKVFLDTREIGNPLAFQIGTTNKYIPEGLSQVVEGMTSGSVRLAVLPAEAGYGAKQMTMPGNVTVPANSKLYYEIELLRCQTFTLGLACCTEKVFTGNQGSCIKKPDVAAAAAAAAAAQNAAQ